MDKLFIPIEYRADESRESPGRLTGVLMTYSERASDRPELFDPGSLRFRDDGLVIRLQHDRQQPLLKTQPIIDGNVVRVDAPLPNSTRGRDTAVSMAGPNPLYTGPLRRIWGHTRGSPGRGQSNHRGRGHRGRIGGLRQLRLSSKAEVRQEDVDRILLEARRWL